MIDLDKLEADAKRVLSLAVVRKDNEYALQAWADHSNNCKAETVLSLIAIARAAERYYEWSKYIPEGLLGQQLGEALKAIKAEESDE
jgi:hypothetical protein